MASLQIKGEGREAAGNSHVELHDHLHCNMHMRELSFAYKHAAQPEKVVVASPWQELFCHV